MFSCFSKKKNKHQSHLPSRPILKSTTRSQESHLQNHTFCNQQQSNCVFLLPSIKEDRHREDEVTKKTARFQSIDNILKEEIELGESKQGTASFEQKVKSSKHTQKFVNIEDQQSVSRQMQQQKDGQVYSFDESKQSCNLDTVDLDDEHVIPTLNFKSPNLISEIQNVSADDIYVKSSTCFEVQAEKISRYANICQAEQFGSVSRGRDMEEDRSLDTTITLDNFRLKVERIQKKQNEEQDESLKQTFQQAENVFYCQDSNLNQQFTRAVIVYRSPQLAKTIYLKMDGEDKNKMNVKGYTPLQLVVVKALAEEKYLDLAKIIIYDEDVSLECRGPEGWTPLQEALLKRNIPLSTHLFRSAYHKKQQKFKKGFAQLVKILSEMPNFRLQIEVKVDSFLPLVGALTPNDTLKINKVDGKIMLEYTLVGYQFPICKRREMGVFFDGDNLYAINNSKNIYCDLLQELDQQQMILLVEDMLVGQVKKGEPIVHQFKLNKKLSLFDNEIQEEIGGFEATKYQLQLRYTSTAQKRRSNRDLNEDVSFLTDYGKFRQKKHTVNIQEKNKNKKVELQLWLAKDFGLDLDMFLKVIEVLGAGNTLLGKWSSFFRQKLRQLLAKDHLFPVQIDIPLNYSLYFNIKFTKFELLQPNEVSLELKPSLHKIGRKEFQGVTESREKRALFLQAYT